MKLLKEFMMREIAGETILVPVGQTAQEFNGMINLTETAKVMWENFEKVDSEDEMVQLILEMFEVDEETARRDVHGFTAALVQEGFLAPSKEDGTW